MSISPSLSPFLSFKSIFYKKLKNEGTSVILSTISKNLKNIKERVDFVFFFGQITSWLYEGWLYHVRVKHDFTIYSEVKYD